MTDSKAPVAFDIGIIAAMQIELDGIAAKLEDIKKETVGNIRFLCGTLYGKKIVCAVCGVGKVFAAMCAQTMILKYSPACIVNTGVAGGLASGLRVLDVVAADSVVQYDMDTSALGDPVGMISGINTVKIPCNETVLSTLKSSVEAVGAHCVCGTVASGDRFIADAKSREYIKSTFGAAACEMEGAAVGQVCFVNRVPFGVLRAVSDCGDGSAPEDFPTFAKKAAAVSSGAVLEFVKRI